MRHVPSLSVSAVDWLLGLAHQNLMVERLQDCMHVVYFILRRKEVTIESSLMQNLPRAYPSNAPPPCGSVSFASDRTNRILRRTINTGVRDDLILVMADLRFSDRADVLRPSLQHVWVVGW